MSSLLHNLGLSKQIAFHDVYSIDEPELLSFVPRPAHALLLVFPLNETYEKFRTAEDKDKPEYQGSGLSEEVMWYKQTIGNACGLIGLLHGVSNGEAKRHIGMRCHLEDCRPMLTSTLFRGRLQLGKSSSRSRTSETH